MKVSIMQPAYLPWLGYFDRIYKSDVHIILDHVSLDKNSQTKFANRNKIRTLQGSSWLTVPILSRGSDRDKPIKDIQIENSAPWRKKHLKSLQYSYSKTPFYETYMPFFEKLYASEWTHLSSLNNKITHFLLEALAIKTRILYSSTLPCTQTKSKLILELCRIVGASSYISGPFGRTYLDNDAFIANNIDLYFHDYQHPTYSQTYSEFMPYMCILDLLLNQGNKSLNILTSV